MVSVQSDASMTTSALSPHSRRRVITSSSDPLRSAGEGVGKRYIRLVRKEPGQPLGFTMKTIVMDKKDHSGLPTGEVWLRRSVLCIAMRAHSFTDSLTH